MEQQHLLELIRDGCFYICPAFFYNKNPIDIGNLDVGLHIKNQQLYCFDHAPICQKCDAWQCKRCIWLNQKTTLEVNIPSHEQCVVAHLERNAARKLQQKLSKKFVLNSIEIKEIDYLDPFDKL